MASVALKDVQLTLESDGQTIALEQLAQDVLVVGGTAISGGHLLVKTFSGNGGVAYDLGALPGASLVTVNIGRITNNNVVNIFVNKNTGETEDLVFCLNSYDKNVQRIHTMTAVEDGQSSFQYTLPDIPVGDVLTPFQARYIFVAGDTTGYTNNPRSETTCHFRLVSHFMQINSVERLDDANLAVNISKWTTSTEDIVFVIDQSETPVSTATAQADGALTITVPFAVATGTHSLSAQITGADTLTSVASFTDP